MGRIQKYSNILYEKLVIALKGLKEYKANLYTVALIDLVVLAVYLVFLSVLQEYVPLLTTFSTLDYVLYYAFMLLEWKGIWFFSLINFRRSLLKGELNVSLSKPVNSFFYFSSKNINGATIISGTTLMIIIGTIIVVQEYSHILLALCSAALGILFFVLLWNVSESLAFFMKEVDFLLTTLQKTESLVKRFTPSAFDGMRINPFYLFPAAIAGFLPMMILKGNVEMFLQLLPLILTLELGAILIIALLWHFGLKKYEGFG